MKKREPIIVPSAFYDTIYSICLMQQKYCEKSSDIRVRGIGYAMGAIMNRIRKADSEFSEIEYDWAISLVNAVFDLYPNGTDEPEDVKLLKDFLFEKTGYI